MARTTVKGLDKLRAKLAAMPDEVKREMRSAYEKNGDELVGMMKRLAPVDPSVGSQAELRESIGWFWSDRGVNPETGERYDTRQSVKGQDGLSITVTAGSEQAYYARWVEFGTTDGKPAQPFFFPSYRALRKRLKSRVTRAQNKAIKRVAAR